MQLLKDNKEKLNQNVAKFKNFSKLIDVNLREQRQKQVVIDYMSILFQLCNEIYKYFSMCEISAVYDNEI